MLNWIFIAHQLISSTDRHVAPLEHIILTTSFCSYSLWPHAHQLNRQTCCYTWTHYLDNKSLLLLLMASCSSAQQIDMLLHLNTISWQPDFVLTLYSCMVSMEAPNTNFIVFNLTWPEIYCTQGDHTNNYTSKFDENILNLQFHILIQILWEV
jgi:hypothetical protein